MTASPEMTHRREVARRVVDEAAAEALALFRRRGELIVDAKGPQDFVSTADRQIELMVRERLAELCPGETVVGEEEGGEIASRYWIVDPIDGTSNFLAGSPLWGVSLGFVVDDRPVAGAIRAPVLGEGLAAGEGVGVLLNGEPFQRPVPPADLQLMSMGESLGEDLEASLVIQRRLRERRWIAESFHSTSIGLLFSALGRIEGHIQPVTTMWDIAGGAAVCREAGLRVEIERHADGAYAIRAGTPALLAALG
jgi:myo-inositol-1(or 4)-monophosphatase